MRVNISGHSQGGVWGVVSVVSQSGAIVAFAAAGVLADHVFRPLLLKDGLLSDSVGLIIGTGEGRGIGLLIVAAGLALTIVAAVFGRLDKIRMLEEGRSDED